VCDVCVFGEDAVQWGTVEIVFALHGPVVLALGCIQFKTHPLVGLPGDSSYISHDALPVV
jgi:hypothetical protein